MASATDQQILDGLRTAYYSIAVKGVASYTLNGRTFTSLDLGQLQKSIAMFEERIASAADPDGIGGGTALMNNFCDDGGGR